ncbi:MAG: response regulator [Lutispora sp.]|nr:response regulator [Lutispora sp.]
MKRVLVADDSTFMRKFIKKILEINGLQVVGEAENGAAAVIKYKVYTPDIVTMDITMPEMTGLEALKHIMEYDPRAKVIMLTAMGQKVMMEEAIMLGAKSFIIKPFKDDELMQVIRKVLK